MCGIYGFISSSGRCGPGPENNFIDRVADLLRFAADSARTRVAELPEADRAEVLRRLDAAQAACSAWMERDAFLRALSDVALQSRLRDAAGELTAWTAQLDAVTSRGGFARQGDWEFLNRLIVGGRDMAWQLERDLLGNMDPVLSLIGRSRGEAELSPADEQALAHAWQLNLVLGSLNRLEVRGRDSAGLAAYLRFPGSGALESFLDGPDCGAAWRRELERRTALPALTHGTLVRPATSDTTLLAVFKVANEVGKMGDNTAFLRQAIRSDRLFQAALREPGVELQLLAHTRWASNGIISLPNCHPVDGATKDGAGRGEVIGVLNGDVDNYRELLEKHAGRRGLAVDESITTDAKIIPLVVARHYRETKDLREAFVRAFAEFEGSMAIGVMAADRPGEFLFGQKGSGQGLFLGLGLPPGEPGPDSRPRAVAIASEMYGLVEFTPRYLKAEGERVEGGEVFHLTASSAGVRVEMVKAGAAGPLPEGRIHRAEITTRDINRGEKPHFFLKEIGESIDSVKKTLRGKFEVAAGGGRVRFHLGTDVLTPSLLDALRSGKVRRILVIGQGTAAVAGEGIAHLLEAALGRARPAFQIAAIKATELSGHYLREDMSDTLIVAVSQSGTTTDTNRTVDMARNRGAWIIGIVNRRNSDLVYKAHGVLYTSDGRDIEMSVASTKAFYAQNAAGQLLALALASELETLDEAQLIAEVRSLEALPDAMARTLALEPEIAELARRVALRRRHWAVVGSGMGRIAADEVRIKLSELCYKSIAVDFLEDKKHIDLSSEPLIFVCANGIPRATVSDAVKEVAIFKAHKAIPIVIADEGEERFDPYAAGTIRVPRADGLGYLLATMAGHLFGYHAAARFDHMADRLRAVRAEVLNTITSDDVGSLSFLPASLTERAVELEALCVSGELDGGLDAGKSARLLCALHVLLGWHPVDVFCRRYEGFLDGILKSLSDAISELARPIDAIKHQAKTVTVGISRGEAAASEGPLVGAVRALGLSITDLGETHRRFLAAFEPLVEAVEGTTLYRIEGLNPLGRPTEGSTILVLRKTGVAREIYSRAETPRPLSGTKWGVVKNDEIHIGYGQTDGRKILMVPVIGPRTEGHVLLYHLVLVAKGRRDLRLRALRARGDILERLQIAVTERNLPWSEALIDAIDNDALFFERPEAVAEMLATEAQETVRKS